MKEIPPSAGASKSAPTLRRTFESDLRIFFEHQQDPEARAMAASPVRAWTFFLSRWREVLGDQTKEARTIVVDDRVAGYVASWGADGKRLVAYWIGSEFWGRGIAPSALDGFLRHDEHRRPIHAYVAVANTRSIRVLEKCGFGRVGQPVVGPDGVPELLFRFEGAVGEVSHT